MIKLLAVDDSALVRKLIGQVFAAEGDFEVQIARDGREALGLLQTFQPDVVTLDIHMPQMDGLACLDRIMVERPTPVVMVSSLTEEGADATLQALELGAVDFVAKPGGAVSMRMAELGPELVAKVRAAATAKLRSSLRLKDRVRHRIGERAERAPPLRSGPTPPRAGGQGVVLIGCSTGGPPALEAVLTPLPADFPWPIVVAQHMPQSFTGPLARRLDGICAVEVVEVRRPLQLQPGCVYIGRGDADVVISHRPSGLVAMAAPARQDYPWHPSVERLVLSALGVLPASQLIGVLMTGMGDDGAAAMTRLQAEGGRTIAEAEETAVVWGMPGELVKAGGASMVLRLEAIADHIQKLAPACP